MVQFNEYISGGIKLAQLSFYDSAGLACGSASALANGEDAGMMYWRGMKNVDITTPERERQSATGDDELLGTFTFPSTDPVTLGLQFGKKDLAVASALQNTNLYDNGQFEFYLANASVDDLPLMFLQTHSLAKRHTFGQRQIKGYEVNMFFSGEISDQGPDSITERQIRAYDYFMACDPVSVFPWDSKIAVANEGARAAPYAIVTSDYFNTYHFFKGDGTIATITLDETPIGVHTLARAFRVTSYNPTTDVTTVIAPTTGFTVAGSVVTLIVPPLAGHHVTVSYKVAVMAA